MTSLYHDDTRALDLIDARIRTSMSGRDSLEWYVPALIGEDDLARCGYLTAFPTQITAAATIRPSSYERMAAGVRVQDGDVEYRRTLLSPAACLNIYPMIARHPSQRSLAVTARATVFRHESHFEEMTRLWEFPVREFVFAGDEAFVRGELNEAADRALRLAARFGITAVVCPASDHFYPTLRNRVRLAMQAQLAMKSELVARLGGQDVPLASFNYHRTHFSAPFGFDRGNSVVTGCVGFGLHRWLSAIKRGKADDAAAGQPLLGPENGVLELPEDLRSR